MAKIEGEKLRLGVSSCLLGERVRYDGGHKRDAFLTETLGPFAEWIPVCPEMEIGLGVPRPTLRLVGEAGAPRLVMTGSGRDLTAVMRRFAQTKTTELERLGLDGYVLKRASPSCGLWDVRVERGEARSGGLGRGLFADALVRRLPALPVEEEGRLADEAIRENFIERVFAARRWRAFVARRPRRRDLVAFHARHRYAVRAHSPAHYVRLGRLVTDRAPIAATLPAYGSAFLQALAIPAMRARHVSVLRQLAGLVGRDLGAGDRRELRGLVDAYQRGRVPLAIPLTQLRHHVRRGGVASLVDQVYLDSYPADGLLRSSG